MKKLLTVSAIAALGFTSVALAGGLPEEMPIAPAAVSASDAGVYFGLQGGFGMTNWKNLDGIGAELTGKNLVSVSNDNGAVGRAFLGYDINKYFALEGGFTYFFNKAKMTTPIDNGWEKVKSTQAIDLMGKIKAPVVENFDIYGKIGANYLMSRFEYTSSINTFNVAYGFGADYYITPNIIANIEWLRFNGNDKVKDLVSTDAKYQPHTDAFLLGLRYRIEI